MTPSKKWSSQRKGKAEAFIFLLCKTLFPVITVVIFIVTLQHFPYFSNLFLFLSCKILT